jgi:integrase
MSGHVCQRGKKNQWYAVINVVEGGKRKRRWHRLENCTTKKEAKAACTLLEASKIEGAYVDPSKLSVADWVRSRIDQWEAAADITARTAQGYRQLLDNQIAPHIGAKPIQKLTKLDVEGWHTILRNTLTARNTNLTARTIGHAHRVLGKALRDAVEDNLLTKNVCSIKRAPKVPDDEKTIVQDVPAFIAAIRKHERFYPLTMVALFTGMRLSEILALKWSRVDLDRKLIQVREALEQTAAHGVRFKVPKSKAGRRDITLPDMLVDVLREHRRATLELRMQLGLGKLPDDALLFSDIEGNPLQPNSTSAMFGEVACRVGIPDDITFHSLRHTHASQLIDSGVDIVTISKRLGHAKPDITLRVYAHLFRNDDSKAAAAIDAAFR